MAIPSPARNRPERRRPGKVAEQHRSAQSPAKPTWYRRVDATVAYTPKSVGFATGVVALWASPNKVVGTGILASGAALDIVSTCWARYKERRKERDEDR